MFLVGPFVVSNGTMVTQVDPSKYTFSSAKVQVQNSSAYLLTISIGGAQYFVTAFTAATIECNSSPTLLITPSNPVSNFGVLVQLAWLQSWEQSPMQDGPLSTSNIQSLGLHQVSENFAVVYPGGSYLLPLSAPGYAYSMFSVTLTASAAGSGTAYFWSDSSTDNPAFQESYTTTTTTTMLNGFIMPKGVWLQATATPVAVTLRYDVFPAPAL